MSAPFRGLGPRLQTAEDLFRKAEHDFDRMRTAPADPYAAFDFFVTADHLTDWTGATVLRKTNDLVALVYHLSSGAKHFEATHPRHVSATGVTERHGAFQAGAFQAGAFDVGGLAVHHNGYAGKPAGTVDAFALAGEVLAFWRGWLGL